MMTCETFRSRFAPATEDADVLQHLRACDACVNVAIESDPDALFRAIGGSMTPPGGVDAFVSDVMREVRIRSTEGHIAARRTAWWPRGLAAAAALSIALFGGIAFHRQQAFAPAPAGVPRAALSSPSTETKPIIESYESENATIVEVPTDGNVQLVMIIDESLPADL